MNSTVLRGRLNTDRQHVTSVTSRGQLFQSRTRRDRRRCKDEFALIDETYIHNAAVLSWAYTIFASETDLQ